MAEIVKRACRPEDALEELLLTKPGASPMFPR